ncbi:MAG: helix-turn-helix domain-containing protein [Treponemataceae bacterium]|nr:helix-turn-helix domain-containing protein [Treponemataceae bacterium]
MKTVEKPARMLQILHPSKAVPLNITFIQMTGTVSECHPYLEILFCLSGSVDIIVDGVVYNMHAEDVILVNKDSAHSINSFDSSALSITFPAEVCTAVTPEEPWFNLNSSGNTESPHYDMVRHYLALLVKLNSGSQKPYATLGVFYQLLHLLTEQFRSAIPPGRKTRSSNDTVQYVMNYIQTHYAEHLTLSGLAEKFYISAPYLSACFEKQLNTTFMAYYTEVRLTQAVHRMLTSDETIETIALECGFRNVRSYTESFKKTYGMLPSEYRLKNRDVLTRQERPDIPDELNLNRLARYLDIGSSGGSLSDGDLAASTISLDAGTVDLGATGTPLKHTFRKFCCVGSARQFLYADVQQMLKRLQSEIGYEYVKFHGILSDEMMVYDEDSSGNPLYSFVLVDKVLDFLSSIHLKPLIQLSFIPVKLASDPQKNIDFGHFNTSPPRDVFRWCNLVETLVKHCISRYGLETVRGWLFCVWNEPDASESLFGWNDEKQFYDFYRRTLNTVKNIDSQLVFGSPSLLFLAEEDSWASRFLDFCRKNACMPDFLNVHYYDNSFPGSAEDQDWDMSGETLLQVTPLQADPYAFSRYISKVKELTANYSTKQLPIYLTEWNLTISHRDPINDTCFKAVYLAKNLLQNYDRLDSFGYWTLTDFHEELQLSQDLYHGGLGLFTYNGIAKAHYSVFRFMKHLGDTLLSQGNGWFITRKNNGVVLILYNYEHYSKLFSSGILSQRDVHNRYAPFIDQKKAVFRMKLEHIPTERCAVREMYVNRNYGSSYDAWVRMGAQPLETQDEYDFLDEQSHPAFYLHQENVHNGVLEFETSLDNLEVRYVEITPV